MANIIIMEKLNKTFSNATRLQASDLNQITSKIDEVIGDSILKNMVAMPDKVYDYLKTVDRFMVGSIGIYHVESMTQDEINSWISANYSGPYIWSKFEDGTLMYDASTSKLVASGTTGTTIHKTSKPISLSAGEKITVSCATQCICIRVSSYAVGSSAIRGEALVGPDSGNYVYTATEPCSVIIVAISSSHDLKVEKYKIG